MSGRYLFDAPFSFLRRLILRLSCPSLAHYVAGAPNLPPPLTPEEEKTLLARMMAGDRAARDDLITHNLRLVVYLAKKYENTGVPAEDMISIGTIGLIKAVDTFDPARASKFASYASRCIENELRMELRKIRREGAAVSLQEPLESGSGQLTLADTLPDDTVMEDDCERRADAARLRRLVDTLPVRERALLQLRYGLGGERPATQQQTADKLGISRSYVSRLEKRALTRLMNAWRR